MQTEDDCKHTSCLIEPNERLKHLINYSNAVEVDYHIPPTRYYRSGLEMVRMATVYYNEGNLENAYVLYLKFMTLFLEKIRKHPDFNTVPVKMKAINQAKLREILPKAEKLKEQLLRQYKEEYNIYLQDRETKKKRGSGTTIKTDPRFGSIGTSYREKTDEGTADLQIGPEVDSINYPDLTPVYSGQESDQSRIPSVTPSAPIIDRSKKPSDIFDPHVNASYFRKVIIPDKVMTMFQSKAAKNTINNIETCGILAGKLAKNELIITHMILPKQKGTSDSCTTMNEEEIFDFQDQHNLITIGWIHTHPTQTAFLSSVDLHTHCPYQLLMPEAIAIVCAPRYNETGFFILTPDYGLKFIANCRKSGFHPHPTEPPLFMVAEHVRLDQNANLEVLDLRT